MTEPSPISMSKQAVRGRATRQQLIEVATRLFAERGYEDTSIEAVQAAADISRGALYHHFAGKEVLFEAVVASVEDRIATEMAAATGGAQDPMTLIRATALGWIDLAGDPVIQRIILLDAPSVLGWERWRAMDEDRSLGTARTLLQSLADAGKFTPRLVNAFAHMMLAALDEMALVIARAADPEAAMTEGRLAVEEMLRRLLVP